MSCRQPKDLSDFRARLKLALQKLQDIGFLKSFMVRDDIVQIAHPKKFKNPMTLSLTLTEPEPDASFH
jgi:hypothetical protein